MGNAPDLLGNVYTPRGNIQVQSPYLEVSAFNPRSRILINSRKAEKRKWVLEIFVNGTSNWFVNILARRVSVWQLFVCGSSALNCQLLATTLSHTGNHGRGKNHPSTSRISCWFLSPSRILSSLPFRFIIETLISPYRPSVISVGIFCGPLKTATAIFKRWTLCRDTGAVEQRQIQAWTRWILKALWTLRTETVEIVWTLLGALRLFPWIAQAAKLPSLRTMRRRLARPSTMWVIEAARAATTPTPATTGRWAIWREATISSVGAGITAQAKTTTRRRFGWTWPVPSLWRTAQGCLARMVPLCEINLLFSWILLNFFYWNFANLELFNFEWEYFPFNWFCDFSLEFFGFFILLGTVCYSYCSLLCN